jgi:lipopolysaccharide transport system ATP-binding protein
MLTRKLSAPFRGLKHLAGASNGSNGARSKNSVEEFWALKDVSFELEQGETVGIIGRNGAGKSTLLKILSRITEPTEGEVQIQGRVASLLEVGTGFHPELTGRENIFLNGAILGMSKVEIRRKFDEIVAFAEVEKFLDTPVKRYSSGMYVRLAFAVAAHLDPEILVVDEVLAVGDAEFQKKCLGKMQDVATNSGRTVLFVSHNMNAVKRLCRRAIYLRNGRLLTQGPTDSVVNEYLAHGVQEAHARAVLTDFKDRSGDGSARVVKAELRNSAGAVSDVYSVGDTIMVQFDVSYFAPGTYSHSVEISNSDGVPIFHLWDVDNEGSRPSPAKERTITATLRDVNLFPDRYFVTLWVGDVNGSRADRVVNCRSFSVEQGNSAIRRQLSKTRGLVYKLAEWSYSANEHFADNRIK